MYGQKWKPRPKSQYKPKFKPSAKKSASRALVPYKPKAVARNVGGPIHRFARSRNQTFWQKVARTAVDAIEGASEIKRWLSPLLLSAVPYSVADDFSGAPYYILNVGAVTWSIRPIQEGIAQGTDEDTRIGNSIKLNGLKTKMTVSNPTSTTERMRVMIISCRKNFLTDASPGSASPLPTDFDGFPRYRDLSVKFDRTFVLNPIGLAGHEKYVRNYLKLRGLTDYQDATPNVPEKNTLYMCVAVTAINLQIGWNTELTYHDR